MLTLGRPDRDLDQDRPRATRVRASLVSIGVHAIIVVGLWHALQFPRAIGMLLGPSTPWNESERLRFFTVAPPPEASTTEVRTRPEVSQPTRRPSAAPVAGDPAAPVSEPAGPPRVVAPPTEVPTGLPAPGSGGAAGIGSGPTTGPLASGRGAVKGVQPGFTEPRIWVDAEPIIEAALMGDAKLDSAVSSLIATYNDSVAAYTYSPNKYERADWTYSTKDGKKYGIDSKFIRLGKVSIPTALLGFLPMNQIQGNPTEIDRNRRFSAMRMEILQQAQQAMNEEEFRRTVKAIRDRKERERKDAEKKKKAEVKIVS